MTQEALKLALEALEAVNRLDLGLKEYATRNLTTLDAFIQSAIDAIKEALAQPEQEPVLRYDGLHEYASQHRLNYNELCSVVRASITTPPQRKLPTTLRNRHDHSERVNEQPDTIVPRR